MRVFDYASLAIKDILRQPIRSLLTIGALMISTVILVTLIAISVGARTTILQQLGLDSSLTSIVVTPNQSVGLGMLGSNVQIANDSASKLDDATVKRLGTIPHVTSADPLINVWEFKNFSVEGTTKTFVAQANGISTTNQSVVSLGAGTLFDGAKADHQVILGHAYAKELGFEKNPDQLIGKTITIKTVDGYRGEGAEIPGLRSTRSQIEAFARTSTTLTATISGVSAPDSRANQLLLPMAWAQAVKSVREYNSSGAIVANDQIAKSGYSTVAIEVDATANVKAVTAEIDKQGFGYISTQQQIDRITSLTTIMWGVLGSIAAVSLITAGLGIANTMLTTIAEQRYAIGVWRAVGARKRTIALRFIIQAGILGIIGGSLGAAAGWAISLYANHYIKNLLVAQGLPAADIITVSMTLLAMSVLITTLFGILSGIYPAWRAARQDPSRALSSQ